MTVISRRHIIAMLAGLQGPPTILVYDVFDIPRRLAINIAIGSRIVSFESSLNVYIVHDSQKGNGKELAGKLAAELETHGAQVVVGHRSEITPDQVAENPPDLLVVGAAVRRS